MSLQVSSLEAAAIKSLFDKKSKALNVFRPQNHQEPIFAQPRPRFLLVTGGNRGGKTICLMTLLAGVAIDAQITFHDGSKHDCRMPWQKNKPLLIWIICVDARHVGNVIYPALFKSGFFEHFKVVNDPETKELRAYDKDKDVNLTPKMHPALIPPQYVGNFSWESKADRIFNKVEIINPATKELMAEIHAYTSGSEPPQGNAADFLLIDENLTREKFIGEMQLRMADKRGCLVWSSMVRDEDDKDYTQFRDMVEKHEADGTGLGKKITLTLSGNKSLPKVVIEETLATCVSEEERLQRDLGIMPTEKLRMYPLFDKETHSVDGYDDMVSRTLKKTDGIPPNDWTKWLIVDPGTQKPGVLFCAVPPPEFGNYFIPYQEVYPGRADPWQMAELIARTYGNERWYDFIIDWHAGRQQSMGLRAAICVNVREAWRQAFEEFKIQSHLTRHNFRWGSDDVGGRQLVVQGWMHTKEGIPKLRIVSHRCPNLVEQLKRIKKKVANKEVIDDRKAPGADHDLVDCLEYWAASGPKYTTLPKRVDDMSPLWREYLRRTGQTDGRQTHAPVSIGTKY